MSTPTPLLALYHNLMIAIINFLARFPLSSEVLGPRVVNFKKFWCRDVPASAP